VSHFCSAPINGNPWIVECQDDSRRALFNFRIKPFDITILNYSEFGYKHKKVFIQSAESLELEPEPVGLLVVIYMANTLHIS